MGTFKRIMETAEWEKLCKSDMNTLTSVLNCFFEEVQNTQQKLVEETLFKVDMTVSVHFSKESAEYVVSKMENEDGTSGEHWNYETTRSVMKELDYDFECGDWYYVLNMMYSDYYCKEMTDEYYIKLAYQFLSDKDAPCGKAKKYYVAMNYCN